MTDSAASETSGTSQGASPPGAHQDARPDTDEQAAAAPGPAFVASEESLREGFKEARADARAYMDLRFKHFTTFAVILGIAAVAVSRPELDGVRAGLAGLMLTVTALFWSIDARTAQYHRGVTSRIQRYEEVLRLPQLPPTPGRRRLPATAASNILFLLAAALWLAVLAGSLLAEDRDPPDSSEGHRAGSTARCQERE